MVSRLILRPGPLRKPGFTLAEVLVGLALFGLIAALAFAPSVTLVRGLEEARSEQALEQVSDYLLGRIAAEMRFSPRFFPGGPAVVLIRRDVLSGTADDRLAFWSDHGRQPGIRALKIFRPGTGRSEAAGLYRWVLPLASPGTVDWENLDPGGGTLVLPGADSLRVSLLSAETGEWGDEYEGPRPRGVRFEVRSGKEAVSREDWLPPE